MMFSPKALELLLTEQSTGIGKVLMVMKPSSGFTLIEIIIVFTLIGILVGMGIPQYQNAVKRAREAVLKENLFQMRTLINQYYTDKGRYPSSLQSLVEEGYLKTIPVDPIARSKETWVEVREEFTEEMIMAGQQPGVVDVLSGSEEKALDGTHYSTW